MINEHNSYIETAVVNAVNGDNVEFLNNIKQAIYIELSKNDEFSKLQDEIDKYSNMFDDNKIEEKED